MRRWTLILVSSMSLAQLGRKFMTRERAPLKYLKAEGDLRLVSPNAGMLSGVKADIRGNDLPPWPIDEIEFNTRALGGGHDIRRAHEEQAALLTGLEGPGGKGTTSSGKLPQPQPLTEEQCREVRQVEKTEEGVRAIEAGGWVCGSCLRCMPYRSRSICDVCHSLRHDTATTVSRWRETPTTWFCSRCCEFNFERDIVCRCCDLRRDEQVELRFVHHERVPDEIQRAPIGSVIVTRNRISRWRCTRCSESNAIQLSLCRNCQKERFDFNVCCPSCKVQLKLNNKKMYGGGPTDQLHVSRPFGLHNCFPRLAPEQRCDACQSPLHGATASSRSDAWLCGCGQVCNSAVASCIRCRIPRRLPQTSALDILRTWDFEATTNWYCEGCSHLNKASRHIVALERSGSTPSSASATDGGGDGDVTKKRKSTASKIARILHGHTKCERCGLPWHHQSVNDGQHWRCACHKVNRHEDALCQVCYLPALDDIRSDVLSFWSRGDWYCVNCHRQNYREKAVCTCGSVRHTKDSIKCDT